MKRPPHPYTWTPAELQRLEAEVAKLTDEKAPDFCAGLPAAFPHIASATYNRSLRRIEVALHGGLIGFSVSLPPVAEKRAEKAA